MKTVKSVSQQSFSLVVQLSEAEARALDALVGYGDKAFMETFIKTFYEKMGQHYMKPNEDGLRSLFATVRTEIAPHLSNFDKARKVFETSKPTPQ